MKVSIITRFLSAFGTWLRQDDGPTESQPWVPRVLSDGADFEGEITQVLRAGKEWRVKYTATFWSARSHIVLNLSPGDEVRIVGRQGGALLIEPLEKQA